MEPGSELDALVAEKVMGWKRIDRKVAGWGDGPQVWATGDDSEDGSPTRQWFEPSTDIAAAWPVFEKLRMMLPAQEIMLYYCNGWNVGSLCQAGGTIEIGDWCGEIEPVATAPHAICLAAKAVEENGRLP